MSEPTSKSELAAQVAARAASIKSKISAGSAPATAYPQKLDKNFVLECLKRNKVGDASLFCALFRDKYVFVQEWERFLYWAGHYWEVDKRNRRALADVERVCKAYQDAWAETNEDEGSPLHKLLTQRLRSLRGGPGRRELLECATTIDEPPVIAAEQLDQQPYLLATPTGVVDLRTGDCSPGRQEQYLTAACPTPWQGLDAPCPTFRQYLLTCMADDQEMADFLVRLMGYALLGEKRLHVWAIMYGPLSRNGKDTLMNVMKHVLGRRLHVRIPVTMLVEQKFQRDSSQPQADLMALRGTRIAYASEANSRQALDQAKIKDLTGGGYITARGLTDREMTEWKQSALLLLLTNYLPKLDAADDGFNARTICIEWPVKFVANPVKEYERQIDYNIAQKLEAEASGILALLVQGCMDVTKNGLQIPERVLNFTREQIDSFDDIGKFLKECCELEDQPIGGREYLTRTPASELIKVCNWWCRKVLGNSFPYTPKKFTPALERKGIFTKKSSVMYYMGVQVKEDIRLEYEDDLDAAEDKRSRRS